MPTSYPRLESLVARQEREIAKCATIVLGLSFWLVQVPPSSDVV